MSAHKHNPKIIYLIADQSSDLTYLYQKFNLAPTDEQSTSLRFELLTSLPTPSPPPFSPPAPQTSPQPPTQLYIFPRNRQLKSYCQLYTSILPRPNLVIYAIDIQSSIKECIEWLNLFQKDNGIRIAFFSSASTYLERGHVLGKIGTLFLRSFGDQEVFFPEVDGRSFQECFWDVDKVGMSMQGYTRMIPAFSKLKWLWRRILNWRKSSSENSSVI